jgi:hypothetical protein
MKLFSILTFPLRLPFKINTGLAKSMPNRFMHWLVVQLIVGAAFPVFLIAFFGI